MPDVDLLKDAGVRCAKANMQWTRCVPQSDLRVTTAERHRDVAEVADEGVVKDHGPILNAVELLAVRPPAFGGLNGVGNCSHFAFVLLPCCVGMRQPASITPPA